MAREPDRKVEGAAGGAPPRLRRELRGLLLLYVVFAIFSCLVAWQCVGTAP